MAVVIVVTSRPVVASRGRPPVVPPPVIPVVPVIPPVPIPAIAVVSAASMPAAAADWVTKRHHYILTKGSSSPCTLYKAVFLVFGLEVFLEMAMYM